MPASILTAGGLFWYGWGAQPSVHPAVPIIGLVVFSWGTYIIYLGMSSPAALSAESC